MERAAATLVLCAAAALLGACDTGDGRTLRPPPSTTTPPPTVTTTAVPATTTFDDGFGELTYIGEDAAGPDLGFAVTLCRWQPRGATAVAPGQPVLTITAEGVTGEGDHYSLTLEDLGADSGGPDARVAVSFTSGPLWEASSRDGGPPALQVVEQTAGLVVRAEVEVTETHPTEGTRPLGLAVLDLTCL